MLIIYTC